MTSSQWHCIQRNNHYSKLLNFFDELMYDQIFADVTLILDDVMLKCHKIVLASCSTYFSTMFLTLPREQTIIMLKDVKYSEMKPILEYIYRGKMNVTEDQLGDLLKVAETLQVEGLVKEDSNRNKNNPRREDTMDMTTTPPLDISINNGDNVPTRRPLSLHSSMDHHSYIHNPYTDVFFLSKEKSFPQLYAKDINSNILPKFKQYKHKYYTVYNMNSAIEAVKLGMNVAEATRKYGIPYTTLYKKLSELKIPKSRAYKRSTIKKRSSMFP